MVLEDVPFGEQTACLRLKHITHKRWSQSRFLGLHMACTPRCQLSELQASVSLVVHLPLWPAAQDGPFTVSLWLKANTLNQSGVLFQYLFSASQNATYEDPAVNLDPWAPNQVCWTGKS